MANGVHSLNEYPLLGSWASGLPINRLPFVPVPGTSLKYPDNILCHCLHTIRLTVITGIHEVRASTTFPTNEQHATTCLELPYFVAQWELFLLLQPHLLWCSNIWLQILAVCFVHNQITPNAHDEQNWWILKTTECYTFFMVLGVIEVYLV